MPGALEPDPVSTKQQRIAELAKQSPHMGFTSLAHHIDLRWLHEAYLRTRPDGAPGVDGQTIRDYNANLGHPAFRSFTRQPALAPFRSEPLAGLYQCQL